MSSTPTPPATKSDSSVAQDTPTPSSASAPSGPGAAKTPQQIPIWAKRLLSNKDRDHQIAYDLQVKGATEGAIRWTIYSSIGVGLSHVYWPFFRKQTLAIKGFLISSAAMSGMVIWADHYLLKHERRLRIADDLMRRQARKELGELGIIASESELEKWKLRQLDLYLQDYNSQTSTSIPSSNQSPPPPIS